MKLTSKFLLILMFTIFATLECSNIHKMFSQLTTGEINRGDIIKYYKTNYDPMLELHNTFFDKCIDHLVNQELKKNNSFFMKMVDKVQNLFSQGTTYDKLLIGDLGISIECDNYINQTISETYISRKKEELKKLRSSLVIINNGNVVRPMGRKRSETGDIQINTTTANLTPVQLEEKLRKEGKSANEIATIMTGIQKSGGSSTSSSGSSLSSSSSSTKISGSSTTSKTTTTTISGGSSSSSGSSSEEGNSERSKTYSGSTISGMGAKFSIFSDRKIIKKEGKEYVIIGGVEHLIDADGWIHGLNIDSSDKNINYNIAYENYFDTTCESMLTFMKNKYTQLLADYNMNKDYVHNLQIENRRYIKKVEVSG